MSEKNTLNHIAFIMDGNGRWAEKRGLPRTEGHRRGAETVRTIIQSARDMGVKYLTFYAFSSENWKRPQDEVDMLMKLLKAYFTKELKKIADQGVRIRVLGDLSSAGRLGAEISQILKDAQEKTKNNSGVDVSFCINYGGRDEIVRAVRQMVEEGVSAQDITEKRLEGYLDAPSVPEPDLMIRTGGDMRISNFLLWQLSYAELRFVDALWPDFDKHMFKDIVDDYLTVHRRFGGL